MNPEPVMAASTEEQGLMDRVYRNHKLRQRIGPYLRQRPDVAANAIMSLLAETYLDGVRDGDAFGLASTCREAFSE